MKGIIMNCKIQNQPNFRGTLVTQLKGNHNILEKVSTRFNQKTEQLSGRLFLKPMDAFVTENNIQALEFVLGTHQYIISDGADLLLGNDLKTKKDVSPVAVEKITDTFINIFKALSAEAKFTRKVTSLSKNIESAKKTIKENARKVQVLKDNNCEKVCSIYEKLLELNQRRLNKLNLEYNKAKNLFVNQAKKISENEPYLDSWFAMVSDKEY